MNERMEIIRNRLQAAFSPLECRLEDESHKHVGHVGAASGGGHFRLHIVSNVFDGKTRIARHRLVYDCLNDMMHADIHALAIVAMSPEEAAA